MQSEWQWIMASVHIPLYCHHGDSPVECVQQLKCYQVMVMDDVLCLLILCLIDKIHIE